MGSKGLQRILWTRAFAIAAGSIVALVTGHVAYMVVYSHVLTRGRTMAELEAHAQASGPWFVAALGFPVAYALARRLLRGRGPAALPTGWSAVALLLIFDVTIHAIVAVPWRPALALAMLAKSAGAWAGARVAAR
jgi:hypothetical protein